MLTPYFSTFVGEIFKLSIFSWISESLLFLSKNISFLFLSTIPKFIPFSVNLKSALSDLRESLYSALDVNILYGSATPFVTRSSIITPI